MCKFTLWIVAAAALLPMAAGCSQKSQVVRGQTPAEAYCPQGMAVGDCRVCPGCTGTFDPYAPPGYARGNNFRYCEPRNMVYPTQGEAPALVQYPYYTVKGPDCFFHK